MKFEIDKCLQIINDLVIYCHSIGAYDYQIDYRPGSVTSTMVVKASVKNLSDEAVADMLHELKHTRHREMEEVYWGVPGDTAGAIELSTIGIMLDRIDVFYDGELLTITAERKG